MKALLLILFLLAVNVASGEPISTACQLPDIRAGVISIGSYADDAGNLKWLTQHAVSSEHTNEWFALLITPIDNVDYYAVRAEYVMIQVEGLYDDSGAHAALWVLREQSTGQWYAIIADMSVLGDDGYPHPCAWGVVSEDDVYAIAGG